MSLNIYDNKNEFYQKNTNKKTFTKEMLKELLKKSLDQRLIKLESSAKEHMSNINYTSKYFKEFNKAIQQFSKFFEESETIKEKEKEIVEKKESLESNKESNSSLKLIPKKSNESTNSTNTVKNNTKAKQNNTKKLDSAKNRSHTQGLLKSQQLKKQATSIVLAKNLFPNKIVEEKKTNKQKNIVMSPDSEKKNKANNNIQKETENETPQKNNKSTFYLERNTINLKPPKTEKRTKKLNKHKKISESNRNTVNYNNISEYKTEIDKMEKSNIEKDNLNNLKNSSNIKKNVNKNKKHIGFNIQNKIKNNEDFSKTLNKRYINKTIDIDDHDKSNYSKSTIPNKKNRKLNLLGNSINDVKDIVKLVDNVHQNITKLFDNDRLNNNKSLMMSSLDLSIPNKTFIESNYKSSKNLLTNDDMLDSLDKKGISLKKKKTNHNITLFKDDNNENEHNDKSENKICKSSDEHTKDNNENENKNKNKELSMIGQFMKNMSNEKSKNEGNKRYDTEVSPLIIGMNKENYDFNNDNKKENKKEIIKNIDVIDIFKKDKNILKNILKYLKDIEIIIFTSCNNYLDKERISFLDKKKEEFLQILNLNKDDTMETKIKKIKNEFSEEDISHRPKEFMLSEEAINKLKELNNIEKQQIFKNEININENNLNILIIIYKILFVLLDIEQIYSIVNDNIFWKKSYQYLLKHSNDGKIGDFILEKIPKFSFSSKSFNKIETIIKDNKENIIKDIINNETIMIAPLIKEALEYCGVIFDPEKTQGNIIIKNLKNNQVIINYLNNLKVRYFLAKYEEEEDD